MRRSFDSLSLAQDDSVFEMFEPVQQTLHLSVRLQITQVFSFNQKTMKRRIASWFLGLLTDAAPDP